MLNGTSPAGKAITDFFVLNSSHTSLRINGVLFNPNTLVGPLPDFAVIEVGKAAVFWWHTDESLDYVPVEIHEV